MLDLLLPLWMLGVSLYALARKQDLILFPRVHIPMSSKHYYLALPINREGLS